MSSPVSGSPSHAGELTLPQALQQAAALHKAGRLNDAERWYLAILEAKPGQFHALHMAGVVAAQLGHLDVACRRLERAAEANPQSAHVCSDLGNVLKLMGRRDDALACWERALVLDPALAEAASNRGVVQKELGRAADALASFDAALSINAAFPDAWNNRASALLDLARFDDALASCDRALALTPDFPEALHNRAAALCALMRNEEAIASCDRALALDPGYADALNTRGVALHALGRLDAALASFDRALARAPDMAMALQNRGIALALLRRHEDAARDLARALALAPDLAFAPGQLLHSRMLCCDWRDYDGARSRIIAAARAGARVVDPFALLGLTDSAQDQLCCARTWVAARTPATLAPLWTGERYTHDRIRIAYLSADLHEHALAHLMAGVFEQHDRSRFEVMAASFGPAAPDGMRSRLAAAFERFVDVRRRSDREVAALLREWEVDVAVDLTGHTQGGRAAILALRPAPVQVNYLGYPGTMGAGYIDYILADAFVIPAAQRAGYAESVVTLPDSFQANDAQRPLAAQSPSRAALGLPGDGFVYCSFNNSNKITPAMFDVWMRVLRGIEGSVLWLLGGNAAVERNLRNEARARGVDPARLVFAPRLAYAEHLARYRAADLFLDTLPFNGGATASDALWAGLPVLTCAGQAFAARMAGSLLRAVGLPELVTHDLAAYERVALRLARAAGELAAVKARLAQHRTTSSLFDTGRFRLHLEAAYVQMWQRQQRGDPPADFAVAPAIH